MYCFGRLACHRQQQSEDMFDASCHLCIIILTVYNILKAAMFSMVSCYVRYGETVEQGLSHQSPVLNAVPS